MSVRPSKKERQQQARRQRQEILRRQLRQATYRRIWIAFGGIVAVAIAVAAILIPRSGGSSGSAEPPQGVRDFSIGSRNHVEGAVDYPQDPPAGGDHNPVWLNCDAYPQPVPNENAVHDLEHGAVWITYQPDLPSAQVQALDDLTAQGFILVSPYPGLDAPVVATSWGHQLPLDDATDPRLTQFIRAFKQGPDTPELGAPCTGGLTPTGGAGS